MRKTMMLALAVMALNLSAGGSAQAERYWPWCAYYDALTYNCGFATLQQCIATVSGVGGECRQNVYPAPPPYSEAPRRPRR